MRGFLCMSVPSSSSRRVLVLLAACLVALALPTIASAKSTLQVGFLDNAYAGSDPVRFWSDAKELKAGFMRWDLQWPTIAATKPTNPRNPADPAYAFGATDAFVRSAAAHGLQDRVMFTLWATPKWASSLSKTNGSTADMPVLTAWRDYVAACATRYSGTYIPAGQTTPLPRVLAWETWNEPNAFFALRPQKVKGKPVSPANYVKLLNTLKTQVDKAVTFRPTFVAGALFKQGGIGLSPIAFMRGMQKAKAKFDVLSMHPYNNAPRLGVQDGLGQSKTNPNFIGVGNFQTFITMSNKIFGRKHPIWVTEFGVQTPSPGKSQYVASKAQQARFVYQSIMRFKQLPQVERMTWFLIKDEAPVTTGAAWYTTGLRNVNGSKKPSYGSWIAAASTLRKSPIR